MVPVQIDAVMSTVPVDREVRIVSMRTHLNLASSRLRSANWLAFSFVFACVVVPSLGCAKLRETYYVGVSKAGSDEVQFYRFKLRGDSYLSKTKFASGWYPAAAVEALVGEEMDAMLKRTNEDGAATPAGPKADQKAVWYVVSGPEGRRDAADPEQRLAIVMTGDMTAFTQAIQALADSEAVKKRLEAFARKQQQKDVANEAKFQKLLEKIPGGATSVVPGGGGS